MALRKLLNEKTKNKITPELLAKISAYLDEHYAEEVTVTHASSDIMMNMMAQAAVTDDSAMPDPSAMSDESVMWHTSAVMSYESARMDEELPTEEAPRPHEKPEEVPRPHEEADTKPSPDVRYEYMKKPRAGAKYSAESDAFLAKKPQGRPPADMAVRPQAGAASHSAARPAANPAPKAAAKKRSLDEVLGELSENFQQRLMRTIRERGYTEKEVYKRANLDRKVFSKIRLNENYNPKKSTAILLSFGLRLTLDETLDLLGRAGYTLSNGSRSDLIVRYFIENEIYDVYELDAVLDEYGLPMLSNY